MYYLRSSVYRSVENIIGFNTYLAMASVSSCVPRKLGAIEGYAGKQNEVIYHPPKSRIPVGHVVFFGGDVQDYKENMLAHRDNRYHAKWDLESTAVLLHERFPEYAVLIIKPSKMALMTFSCYENFAQVNNFGAPTYVIDIDSLKHLKLILQNVESITECPLENIVLKNTSDFESTLTKKSSHNPITLIGFSKGCIVLNQFLYSLQALRQHNTDSDIESFVNRIKNMYWLEGGHSGVSSTWVTDKSVLENFAKFKIRTHIHVTPYQVLCDTRPRIGKEEKIFREYLIKLGVDLKRVLHFENADRSLEMHFQVLEIFEKPV